MGQDQEAWADINVFIEEKKDKNLVMRKVQCTILDVRHSINGVKKGYFHFLIRFLSNQTSLCHEIR